MSRHAPAPPVPIISLFCGAGGLDLGFSRAGFQTIAAFDHDDASLRTFTGHFGSGFAVKADLARITKETLATQIEQRGMPRGIIGGPPCQGFSTGNVIRNPNDVRNRLPQAFARVTELLQDIGPIDFFVFENVPGLVEPRHARLWGRLLSRFKKLGFALHYQELNAADFGVPQFRRRLFLVGLHARLGKLAFKFPKGRCCHRPIVSVLGDLPEPALFRRDLDPKTIPHHVNHWTMQPKSPRFKSREFNRWRSFRILHWDRPSPTVAYGNREVHIHPEGHRRLSVYEAMLLQGFPKRFKIHGNLSEQFTQVSNAVPPPLAERIAKSILTALQR